MPEIRIRLPRAEWFYDPEKPLGSPGGFGQVFEGWNADAPVAVKRLHLTAQEAAHREMRVSEELVDRTDLQHVMPVLDVGQDAESDRYFVVMPRAERDLQDEIESRGMLPEAEARSVMLQIATGLQEVSHLVHRDMKPGNVLWLEGRWCIADFGIAKFVEEATSNRTLRAALSKAYAAPEQWNLETATQATDVYALGCIGYALMTGSPPYPGPGIEEYRLQHLQESPPTIEAASPALRSTLSIMLRKSQDTRPSLARVVELLSASSDVIGEGFEAIAGVGATIIEREAQEEARASALANETNRRQNTAKEALALLDSLMSSLFERIVAAAPAARQHGNTLTLGRGEIGWNVQHSYVPEGSFPKCGWDVLAGVTLGVVQDADLDYGGRGAMIWYTDLGSGRDLRWYEVPYMSTSIGPGNLEPISPFPVPDFEHADLAASRTLHIYQLAAQPVAVDDENFDAFSDRWAGWLALAADRRLQRPDSLPESYPQWGH